MQKEKRNACKISSTGLWDKVPAQCFVYFESSKFYVLWISPCWIRTCLGVSEMITKNKGGSRSMSKTTLFWEALCRSVEHNAATSPALVSHFVFYELFSPSHLSHALLSHLLLHLILSFLFITSCYSHLLIFIFPFLSVSLMAFFSLYSPPFW